MTKPIISSKLPSQHYPQQALGDVVFEKYRSGLIGTGKIAAINGDSHDTLSFADLEQQVACLAGGLQKLGVETGSVVALIAPNSPQFAIAFHAVLRLGATLTTVNPVYASGEIASQLNDCKPRVIFTVCACLPALLETTDRISIDHIILLDTAEQNMSESENLFSTFTTTNPSKSIACHTLNEAMGEPLEQVELRAKETTAVLPYSSGTTGVPKGVMLNHFNLVANVVQANAVQQYRENDVALAVLPFFHIYGMQVLMNSLIAEGVTIVTMARFDMEQALSLIQRYRITHLFAVPPIILGLAKHPAVDNYDLSSLRQVFSGAAPLGGELGEEASRRIDCPVVQGYGMTELSPVSHMTHGDDYKAGSSGIAVADTECRIVSENGDDLGTDEIGELWIRGPQVMTGYLNQPEATAECLDTDGWLHTGDLATIDTDGHMTIVDRLKELIKYKGFQVAPAELEALIVSHPAIADVAVIGLPDEEAGEIPKAFIKLQPDTSLAADDVKAYVAEQVSSYKQIREVEFVDTIPKSASGKILRRLLKQTS